MLETIEIIVELAISISAGFYIVVTLYEMAFEEIQIEPSEDSIFDENLTPIDKFIESLLTVSPNKVSSSTRILPKSLRDDILNEVLQQGAADPMPPIVGYRGLFYIQGNVDVTILPDKINMMLLVSNSMPPIL